MPVLAFPSIVLLRVCVSYCSVFCLGLLWSACGSECSKLLTPAHACLNGQGFSHLKLGLPGRSCQRGQLCCWELLWWLLLLLQLSIIWTVVPRPIKMPGWPFEHASRSKQKPEGAATNIPHCSVQISLIYMCSFITFPCCTLPPTFSFLSGLCFPFLFFFLLLLHTVFNLFTDQNNLHALSICPSRFTIKKKKDDLKWVCFVPAFFHPIEALHHKFACRTLYFHVVVTVKN